MPLWSYFTIGLLLLAVAAASGVHALTGVLTDFVPSEALQSIALRVYVLLGLFILVSIGLFFVIADIIVLPLRRVAAAIDAFARTGERIALPTSRLMPREIRTLFVSSEMLMGNTAAAHKRDVEVSQVKSDFISTAAHQLRTPLTGIRWALEALEQSTLTEDQRELVKNAKDKSHELVAIVGTLLDISAIESGKYKYVFVPVNLATLLTDVSKDFQDLAMKSGVQLYFEEIESVPLVSVDRERIRWVLTNLIENAIRYTPRGGIVTLGLVQGPGRVFVTVHDTGIGIPPKDSGNIFERFFRADNAISKESQGNGLGLYIARTIATDHGGDLNFEANTDGPGTTFTLSLPVHGPISA